MINSKNLSDIDHIKYSINNNSAINYSYNIKQGVYEFTFKTCDVIGSLGDNATQIKNLIKNDKYFSKIINSNKIEKATIVGHTRWASVGEVSLENAHPISFQHENNNTNNIFSMSSLNGDIYNHKEIIDNSKASVKKDITSCTTDCLAIPMYVNDLQFIENPKILKMIDDLRGSFVITLQHSMDAENITLIKKGIQGLYLGFSYDGVMFSSDVYGLVENCKYFLPIENDSAINLSSVDVSTVENVKINIIDGKTKVSRAVRKEDLRTTNITTRDIDIGNYEHFLKKEIYDSPDIVEKTINNYLQPSSEINLNDVSELIKLDHQQVPKLIIKNLTNKKMKRIIITGMGTCYTAAVAISMFMRDRLKRVMPDMIIEPHIASEGSGFYLNQNMSDTLVIVIAQSGTTVDTNIYVQMAKDRGAMTLAIANKREGDVTFIVEGTLYIGEGRDIEIAVPSTKTYTAQVIVGYLLSLYFSSKIIKNKSEKLLLLKDIENLRHVPDLINNCFKSVEDTDCIQDIYLHACKYNSWYIARDNSPSSVSADEIRIKYSENCYQSVPALSLNELIDLKIKKSFITITLEEDSKEILNKLLELTNNQNYLVIITTKESVNLFFDKYKQSSSISLITMPDTNEFFSFLPIIIAGQFLSYYLAVGLDRRKEYFINLIVNLHEKKMYEDSFRKFLKGLKEGQFNQGFSAVDLNNLIKLSSNYLKTNISNNEVNSTKKLLLQQLNELEQVSKRTIDTIKHQAKTITVGAVRGSREKANLTQIKDYENGGDIRKSINEELLLNSIINTFDDLEDFIKSFINNDSREILVYVQDNNEALAYNLINFINELLLKFNVSLNIRIARPYDLSKKNKYSNIKWLIISDNECSFYSEVIHGLNNSQYIIFSFKDWLTNLESSEIMKFLTNTSLEYDLRGIWSTFIGVYFFKIFSDQKKNLLRLEESMIKKTYNDISLNLVKMIECMKTIISSESISSQINYSIPFLMSSTNWKCVGSGINYNIAKYSAKRLMHHLRRACAVDVLENHKHIDISAESSLFIFILNIHRKGYQDDAFSEIEKIISHSNFPIVITNEDDQRFNNQYLSIKNLDGKKVEKKLPIIFIPKINEVYSFPISSILLDKILFHIDEFLRKENYNIDERIALLENSKEVFVENIWK